MYHKSGDGFIAQAASEEAAVKAMEKARKVLAMEKIHAVVKDEAGTQTENHAERHRGQLWHGEDV